MKGILSQPGEEADEGDDMDIMGEDEPNVSR